MRTRLALWPIRIKRRGRWWHWWLCGKVQIGACLYGWYVCVGPYKIVTGAPRGGYGTTRADESELPPRAVVALVVVLFVAFVVFGWWLLRGW